MKIIRKMLLATMFMLSSMTLSNATPPVHLEDLDKVNTHR